MSGSVTLFRALLLMSVVTGVLGGAIDRQFAGLIPDTVLQAFKALPPHSEAVQLAASVLLLVTFGGIVGSIVGLYHFKPWSRGLAVAMTLLQLLFFPLGGVWIQSGWAAMLLELSTTLWGVVLAISYVSSLSQRFALVETKR